MTSEEFYTLYRSIMNSDLKVRFVAIIDTQGQIVYGGQRQGMENYLEPLDQKMSLRHALESWRLRTQFAERIGDCKFAMAEYKKIRRYSIPLNPNYLLYITTEPDIDHSSFMKNVLTLKETFTKD